MTRIFVAFVALALALGGEAVARPAPTRFEASWASAQFTPCENFGIHGSYRVFIDGGIEAGPAAIVSGLSLRVASAGFANGTPTVTAKVTIRREDGAEVSSVTLARPTGSVVEPQPGPYESRRLYLPATTTDLKIPPKGTLEFSVSVSVRTPSGSCAGWPSSAAFTADDLFKAKKP